MSAGGNGHADRIDRFFAGAGARGDQWRNRVEPAEDWANGSGSRPKFEVALAEMMATEEFHAVPVAKRAPTASKCAA